MPLPIVMHDDAYFSEEFKIIVRSCKEVLLERSVPYEVTDLSFYNAHKNNFHTFLRGMNVDERLIWPISFINDIIDPTKDFMDKRTFRLIDVIELDRLMTILKTKHV